MASQLSKTLEQALLPHNGDWGLTAVEFDSTHEEVRVHLEYLKETVEVAGREYAIYDYRRERSWRHLDLWQHKTWIVSRVPRYSVVCHVIRTDGKSRLCLSRGRMHTNG
jgi:hypothetical protein